MWVFLGKLVADKLAGLAAEAHQIEQSLLDGFHVANAVQNKGLKHIALAHTVCLELINRTLRTVW